MTTDKTNDTADVRICLAKHTPTSRAVLTMLANLLQGNYPMSRPKDLLADALNKSPEIPGVRNEASVSDILTNVRGGAVYFNVRRCNNEPGSTGDCTESTLRLHLSQIFPHEDFSEPPPSTEEKPAES